MRALCLLLALIASPVAAQSVATPSATPAAASSLIIRAASGYLTGVNVTSGATAGYVMLFDRATVPADGAVSPLRCLPLAANTGLESNYRSAPLRFTAGIVVVFVGREPTQ